MEEQITDKFIKSSVVWFYIKIWKIINTLINKTIFLYSLLLIFFSFIYVCILQIYLNVYYISETNLGVIFE